MIKLYITILLLTLTSFKSLAEHTFQKEHHLQFSTIIPFNFNSDSEDNMQLSINGIHINIPLSDKNKFKTHKTPIFNLSYLYMPKRWFAFGATASLGKEHGSKEYLLLPVLNHKFRETNIALKTNFKFFFLNRKYFDLYSSISVGAHYKQYTKENDKFKERKDQFATAFDFSFIGLSFGNKIYGLAEWHGIISGIKVGLGYKF